MILKVLLPLLIISSGIKSNPIESRAFPVKLGCLRCHDIDNDKINVHLVPHSHDDVGWLKTVDQYFYGMRTDIQQAAVQYIISSVVEALADNPDRRYIQVETAFFWKWWSTQDDDMKSLFKSLVDNGQIEMVNGAWSMNDEACSNYQSTIDQFSWGLRIIDETVGTCGIPRIGWQIDPFGHSREQASLFAQLGYLGVFFARLDHDDKNKRQQDKTLDFAWQGSANLENTTIFGGIFPTSLYFPPNGYCWDYGCDDDPIDDDPDSPDYNVDQKVNDFIKVIQDYVKWYPTKNVFIPMGGDFQYEAAEMNYINMDRFIKAFENNTEINLIYSTPSCYLQAVHSMTPTLKLKTDDFFPYSNDDHSFWTGYFTSRPNSKRFERVGHNILQAAKQLVAINGVTDSTNEENTDSLRYLREVMGIMQHHDAITGTEKQHVANDYVRLLTRGIEHAEQPLGEIVSNLLKINGSEGPDVHLNLSSCLLSNISICHVSQNSDKFIVAVYNPLSWPVNQYIRLPVSSKQFDIQGPDGKEVYDVVYPISNFYFVRMQNETPSTLELVFAARKVPPMGIKLYYISKLDSISEMPVEANLAQDVTVQFGNNQTSFEIDDSTNLLKRITMNGISLDITQNFYYYYSETGEADQTKIASGAYLFRPTKSTPESLPNEVTIRDKVNGQVVEEVHQKWSDGIVDISQIIRVYKDENYIEFDWLVGGINIDDDKMGKEIISRFTVNDFDNNNIFYTDSNGREMIKRTLNSRPDYTYNSAKEPVASNYYPVTSKIVIKDEKKDLELAVLNDRAQGGSSLANGVIEFMVHRRIIHDDRKGVDENLNETEFNSGVYVRGTHYLVLGPAIKTNPDGKSTAAEERILAQKKLVQPWVGVGDATSDSLSYDNVKQNLNFEYSALTEALPENINILTLEPWKNNTLLLRFEHIMEKDEDPALSNVVTLNITNLFDTFEIEEIVETTLGANQKLEDYQNLPKFSWNVTDNKMEVVPAVGDDSDLLSFTPMQLRTFVVTLKPKKAIAFGVSVKPVSFMILLTISMYIYF